jgi:CheY-like chemotaxis protein
MVRGISEARANCNGRLRRIEVSFGSQAIATPHPEQPQSCTITRLPLGEAAPAFPAQNHPSPKRILLADDDPGIREVLGRVLKSEDYAVETAKTGREAVTKFLSHPPDLVLLDLNMPDRDGWEAFRLMNVAHPILPVIVITARPNQYSQADDLGVDALMEKPLHLPLLLETIKNFLAETEAERMARLTKTDFKPMHLNPHCPTPPKPSSR